MARRHEFKPSVNDYTTSLLGGVAYYLYQRGNTHRNVANRHPVTDLGNRRALEQRYARGQSAGVLLVDLDRFKAVNDTYGHDRGDSVLIQTARRLQATVRPGDEVFHTGGDEFVVLLGKASSNKRSNNTHGIQKPVAAHIAASERVRTDMDALAAADPDLAAVGFGASVGAVAANPGDALPDLLKGADREMYVDKLARGGGR